MTLKGKMWNFPEGVSSVASYEKYWKLIQQHLGVDADGIPGPKTALALLESWTSANRNIPGPARRKCVPENPSSAVREMKAT